MPGSLTYAELPPSSSGSFSELILNYWKFEVPDTETAPVMHETMPETAPSIVFIRQPFFKGVRILGPHSKRFQQQIFPGSVFLGIRFNPWINMPSVFGDKSSILNRTVPTPEFLPGLFAEIIPDELRPGFSDFELLEKGLIRLIQSTEVVSTPLVKYLCLRLPEEIKIKQLLKEIPLSTRPVQKHFKAVTGVTMTEFRNIIRLKNTIRMIYLDKENTTHSAFENGYTDHSHFIRTFRKYMHTSVREFLARTSQIELSIKNGRFFTQ